MDDFKGDSACLHGKMSESNLCYVVDKAINNMLIAPIH